MHSKYKIRKGRDNRWHVWYYTYLLSGNGEYRYHTSFKDWKHALTFIGIEI